MKQKITAIHVIGGNSYWVGILANGKDEVTEILNHSQEYPDHCEYFFQVKSNEKTLVEIIGCPVMVEYDVTS